MWLLIIYFIWHIEWYKFFVNHDNSYCLDVYINNFVSIKLDKGNNKIEIRYEMPLFKLGIILSILGIVCLLLYKYIISNKIILNVIYYVYIVVCIFVYLYIYGFSIFKYWNY